MSSVCYLAKILVFLVVTRWLLVITARYLAVTTCYWWLLLVPTFSMNEAKVLLFGDIYLQRKPFLEIGNISKVHFQECGRILKLITS